MYDHYKYFFSEARLAETALCIPLRGHIIPRRLPDSSGTSGLGTRILHLNTGSGLAYY